MSEPISVRFMVNGASCTARAHPLARLLDVLRDDLGFTGTKEGCGEGECGACAVLLDGQLVNSCLVPFVQVEGAAVTTIEGLEQAGRLHKLQAAFLEHGGAQCGICTPGMIVAAAALLAEDAQPDEHALRTGLAGNLCRCTGYTRIFEAVRRAAQVPDRGSEP